MTTAADKLRADILAEVEHCKADLAETECALRVAEAMLRAHDAAVEAMREKEAAPAAPRVTEKRRNKRLTGKPKTVDALTRTVDGLTVAIGRIHARARFPTSRDD